MKKSFLAICSPLDESATASVLLTHWSGYKNHRVYSLLLEAMNQFAVRFATSLYPCTTAQRYLPAMVEHYECTADLIEKQLVLEGNIEPQQGSIRVACRAWSDTKHSHPVADAIIIVHPVALPDKLTPVAQENAATPLWEILSHSEQHCDFRLNGSNRLFSVHFPGSPVCPGSLLIDLLVSKLLHPTERQTLKLQKVKFLRAVRPEQAFRLRLNATEGNRQASFIITADSGERHVSGSYLLSQGAL